jgi:hypothetical protein
VNSSAMGRSQQMAVDEFVTSPFSIGVMLSLRSI